jgi:protein TonB
MRDSIDKGRATAGVSAGSTMRGAASATQMVVAVVVIALAAAAAWWFMGPSGKLPTSTPTAPTSAAAPGTADATAPAEVQELTADQLYKEARSAMGENRMVAPAGNNALEYYLRIIAKQPDDSGAKDALRELFPFATGSAEDQINQGNFDEATRIMNLLAKADPSNYTLTILRSKLDAKKKQNDREQQLAQQAATAAATAAAAKAQAAAGAAATPAAADSAASSSAAVAPATPAPAKPAEIARATPAPSAAPPPAPVEPVGETRDVRVITPPRPAYPPAAARNRQDGWVEVEFTVGADGSVQKAKVVSSNPARVFDREAVRAIEQAKFEPRLEKGQAVASTLRRRIEFKLGN